MQVTKIDIGYAKTAKKMDVKRLKAVMWNILSTPPTEGAAGEKGSESEAEQTGEKDGEDGAQVGGIFYIFTVLHFTSINPMKLLLGC